MLCINLSKIAFLAMEPFYQPLVLDNQNWENFKSNLAAYPLRMSKISKLESNIHVSKLSMKYVANGKEIYKLNGKEYELSNNHYVLTNHFSECFVSINEKEVSQGICIDLDENYLSSILTALDSPGEIDNTSSGHRFFYSDELYSKKTGASERLEKLLQVLVKRAERGDEFFSKEDFLKAISLEVILDQCKVMKEYYGLNVLKTSTRRELYARLLQAQEIMRDDINGQMPVKDIAAMVCLSEFRFHHLFREAFGVTPYQFQTDLLMQKAVDMYKTARLSWTEIAAKTGYSDIQAFSKVFKRKFGVSPRNYREQ